MKIVHIKRAASCRRRRWRLSSSPTACSGGGAPQNTGRGIPEAVAATRGYTFAMITHETPGDTFWDRIRAGAEQAAKDTGSTLKYSSDPDATKQAVADPGRHRLQGRRHRHHAGDAGRADPDGQEGCRRRHPGRLVQLRHRLLHHRPARSPTSPPMSTSPASRPARGPRTMAPRRSCAPSSRPVRSRWRTAAPVSRTAFPNTENIQVNGADDSAVTSADPGQAGRGQGHQLDHHPRRRPGPGRDQGRRPAPGVDVQDRDVRPERRTRPRRCRPASSSSASTSSPTCRATWPSRSCTSTRRTATSSAAARLTLTGPSFVDKTNVDPILPFIDQNTR